MTSHLHTDPDHQSQSRRHVGRGGRAAPQARGYTGRALLIWLITMIGLALMMNGSVTAPYRQIAFLALGLPLLAVLTQRLTRSVSRTLWRQSIAGMVVLTLWGLLQSTPLPFGLLAHPVWDTLQDLGIAAQPTIWVAPAVTRAALPALMLPFLVFAAMILLCQTQREALFAWKALAVLGLALAALSVLLEVAFPQTTFFSRFEVGRGAFNGIFVNRNTTAAFLGLAGFAIAGWLLMPRSKAQSTTPAATWFDRRRLVLGALLFLLVITLITTRSRAGVTLGLICLTLGFVAVFLLRPETDRTPVRRLGTKAKVVLTIAGGIGLFIAFGEPVISRMGPEAEDGRWCAYAATLKMFAERPLVGQGFGTFADAFPQFRDVDCLGSAGIWTRAHNSHLEFLAGMGAIGSLIALALLGRMLQVLIRGVQERRSLKPLPIMTLAALAFMLGHSALDFPLQIPGVALYFAALMGVGCAIAVLEQGSGSRKSRRRSRTVHDAMVQ